MLFEIGWIHEVVVFRSKTLYLGQPDLEAQSADCAHDKVQFSLFPIDCDKWKKTRRLVLTKQYCWPYRTSLVSRLNHLSWSKKMNSLRYFTC